LDLEKPGLGLQVERGLSSCAFVAARDSDLCCLIFRRIFYVFLHSKLSWIRPRHKEAFPDEERWPPSNCVRWLFGP